MPAWSTSQAGLEQDDVGGVARDVDGAGDRDADVGGVQRRRVVDAVAEEADDVAAALERQDDAVLLRGRDAREHASSARRRGASAGSLMRSSSPPSTICADVEADLRADVARDQLVVAGEDLDGDAVARERRDAPRAHPASGGSAKVRKPASVEVVLVARVDSAVARRHDARRDREHAEAVGAQLARTSRGSARGSASSACACRRARSACMREDALGRALGDEQVRAVALDDDRRADGARSRTGSRRACDSRSGAAPGTREDRGDRAGS